MLTERPSAFTRYVLFQVPGWVLAVIAVVLLRRWVDLSLGAATALLAVWVVKDFLLFPFLRSAYEQETRTGAERLIGERGVAVERLEPAGYIRVHGELWRAEQLPPGEPIPEGARVTVHAARGFTLFVQREPTESAVDARAAER